MDAASGMVPFITNALPLLGLLSTFGLMLTSSLGFVCFACMKSRQFSSSTSRIESDAILKLLPQYSHLSWSELFVPTVGWVPKLVISRGFCASVRMASSHPMHKAVECEITVWRPCGLSWDWFEELIRAPALKNSMNKPGTDSPSREQAPQVPLPLSPFLDHLIQSSAHHAYPELRIMSKCAHPPGTSQQELCQSDAIARRALAHLNEFGSGVFLVRGPPMTGKTGAGMRLAQLLGNEGGGAVVCTRFSPFRAGCMMTQLTEARGSHKPDAWLVIFLDEIDVKLDTLGSVPPNSKLLTEITDKDSWNDWLDDVGRCKKIVLWLTSNADDAKIASYDPSLLREKRVTAHYHATGSDAWRVVHEAPDHVPSCCENILDVSCRKRR